MKGTQEQAHHDIKGIIDTLKEQRKNRLEEIHGRMTGLRQGLLSLTGEEAQIDLTIASTLLPKVGVEENLPPYMHFLFEELQKSGDSIAITHVKDDSDAGERDGSTTEEIDIKVRRATRIIKSLKLRVSRSGMSILAEANNPSERAQEQYRQINESGEPVIDQFKQIRLAEQLLSLVENLELSELVRIRDTYVLPSETITLKGK